MTLQQPSGWATRLTDAIGVRPQDVQFEHIRDLVSRRVREDDDLDFKCELYGGRDSDKRELAADIAALANHRGGMIILGVEEHDGAASGVPKVTLSDAEERRIRQIAADLLAPAVEFDIRRVEDPSAASEGCYLVILPPSADRPHAVRVDKSLRYPRRHGTTKRWLSEAEVADLYRDRRRAAQSRRERMAFLHEEALAEVDLDMAVPWIAVGLVPTGSAEVPIDAARLAALEGWSRQFSKPDRLAGFVGSPAIRAGRRRARLTSDHESGSRPTGVYAELHTDGAAVALCPVFQPARRVVDLDDDEVRGPLRVLEEPLIWTAGKCVTVVGRHAIDNAGAYGGMLLELRLLGPAMLLCRAYLGERSVSGTRRVPVEGAREIAGPVVSRQTVPAERLAAGAQGVLAVTRLLLTEVFHAMGAPEVRHIRDDGTLRSHQFSSDEKNDLWQWATQNNVPIDEEGH